MEINITVNEDKFKEVLSAELDAFTKEELHEICREGLVKCMSDIDTFKSLFTTSGSQYSYNNVTANDLLKEAAKKVDLSPCFNELQDKAIEYVSENGQTLIRELVTDMFVQAMAHTFFDTNKFRSEVSSVLYQMQNHN